MADRVGQQLNNYHLIRLLGTGDFGEVYLGEHVHDQRQVAVKILKTHLSPDGLQDFLTGVQTLRLKHPHIMPIVDVGIEGDTPFLVMDYAPNGSLRQRHSTKTRLPLEHILPYVEQVTAALEYAHGTGLTHQDVKPQNMLLDSNNTVLLSDFGMPTIAHMQRSRGTKKQVGSIRYMAPEQIRGKPQPASDQYALGVIVYEWLSGKPPFQGAYSEVAEKQKTMPPPSLHDQIQTITPEVEQVVLKALAKDPQERFTSIRAFATALQQANQPAEALSTPPQLHQPISATEIKTSPELEPVTPPSLPVVPIPIVTASPEEPPIHADAVAQQEHTVLPEATQPELEPATQPSFPVVPIPVVTASPEESAIHADAAAQQEHTVLPEATQPELEPATQPALPVVPIPVVTASPEEPTIHADVAAQQEHTVLPEATQPEPVTPPYIVIPPVPVPVITRARAASPDKTLVLASSTSHSASPPVTPPPAPRRDRSKGKAALLIGFVALVILAGIGLAVLPTSIVNTHPTATQVPATSTTQAPATATTGSANPTTNRGAVVSSDPQHTHFNPNEQVLNPTNVSHLVPYWTGSTGDAIVSSPAVANGVVYVGSSDHKLYAFNIFTGKTNWIGSTGDAIVSSPAVINGIVYVGSVDHKLYAFDATTGKTLWSTSTDNSIRSSPTVVNGVVYIGSLDHKLYALDATTGKPLWTAATGDQIISSPAVVNNVAYVGSSDHKLYAFDTRTGKSLWTASTIAPITYSPAVANGIVYVGSGDPIYAFNAATGQLLWTAPIDGGISSDPAVANGVVYVGSFSHKLYTFDAVTGHNLWTASAGGAVCSETIANGVAYVGSFDHKLYAFDTSTGHTLFTASTGAAIASSPAIVNGVIYVGSVDHALYTFHLPANTP